MSEHFWGSLVARNCLTGDRALHQTWHLTIKVPHHLGHRPGDSVAIYPKNASARVLKLLEFLNLLPSDFVEGVEAYDLFATRYDITRLTSSLLQALEQGAYSHSTRAALQEFALQENCLEGHDLLSLLSHFFPSGIEPSLFLPHLRPLLPRLYSISSGPSFDPIHLELTVAKAFINIGTSIYPGVCSGYLIDDVPLGSPSLKMSYHPSKNFTLLPHTANTIFIATGTGVAPFRSLMQEYELSRSPPSKYWLFFGGRKRESDFFYEDFWNQHIARGYLKMTLAFSQDQEHKIYVQHRMWEERHALWEWIDNGASLYVCGNARTMAKDVEVCLQAIAKDIGGKTESQAADFFRHLRRSGRYRKDVY